MTSVSTEWPPFPIRYVIRALRYSILALASATDQCRNTYTIDYRKRTIDPLDPRAKYPVRIR